MLSQITYWLVVIGGLNWGLVGLGNLMAKDWNVLRMVLGFSPTLLAIVYVLVGLSALKMIISK